MVPTVDELEQYFDYVERLEPPVAQHFISCFGSPGLAPLLDIRVPGLGAFEVPPSPPPPPPKSLLDDAGDYISQHPWITSSTVISALGAGLLVGYSVVRTRSVRRRRVKATAPLSDKRQAVVVVLGGDHPLGLPLIMEFEKQGYIVIASVSSREAVGDVESKGHGYIRALILDSSEPGTILDFLRSLASTLSQRFPITTAGGPYAPTPYHPMVHSVISLLTMPTASIKVVQALLPLLRTDASHAHGHKSIILCLLLPFWSVTAVATLRAADVFRREITTVHGMTAIRIVILDVDGSSMNDLDVRVSMDAWIPSEKATYGAALNTLRPIQGPCVPVDVSTFVDSLVGVVSGSTRARWFWNFFFGIGFGLLYERVKDWIRSNSLRFAIGAGARTYAIASYLLPTPLDGLLVLPHLLMNIRNRLLSPPPPRAHSTNNRTTRSMMPASHPETGPAPGASPLDLPQSTQQTLTTLKAVVIPESHPDVDEQEMASDAEAESN